ncbi:hypothetical protein OC845_006796, partial [Tilletia horrida]
ILAFGDSEQAALDLIARTAPLSAAWQLTHGTKFDLSKTHLTVLTRQPIDDSPSLRYLDHSISVEPHVRLLGVLIDSSLRFHIHGQKAVQQAQTAWLALSSLATFSRGIPMRHM